jgi:hypothetical protein
MEVSAGEKEFLLFAITSRSYNVAFKNDIVFLHLIFAAFCRKLPLL